MTKISEEFLEHTVLSLTKRYDSTARTSYPVKVLAKKYPASTMFPNGDSYVWIQIGGESIAIEEALVSQISQALLDAKKVLLEGIAPDVRDETSLTLPFRPTQDTSITCIVCSKPREDLAGPQVDYELSVGTTSRRAMIGLHEKCRGRAEMPLKIQNNTRVSELESDLEDAEAEIARLRDIIEGIHGEYHGSGKSHLVVEAMGFPMELEVADQVAERLTKAVGPHWVPKSVRVKCEASDLIHPVRFFKEGDSYEGSVLLLWDPPIDKGTIGLEFKKIEDAYKYSKEHLKLLGWPMNIRVTSKEGFVPPTLFRMAVSGS